MFLILIDFKVFTLFSFQTVGQMSKPCYDFSALYVFDFVLVIKVD